MRINHNIAALNTYNKLSANQATTAKSLEKLSSGLKINRAGDDAAGLAISEKMRGQIRGLDQASANSSDGISLVKTAEGALSETHSILQRMRELAVQSSNDTNTNTDRSEIQKEVDQLTSEIDRISTQTEFNTKSLLNGDYGTKATSTNTTNITIESALNSSIGVGSGLVSGATLATTATVVGGAMSGASAVTFATAQELVINGTSISFSSGDHTGTNVLAQINAETAKTGVVASFSGANMVLKADQDGTGGNFTIGGNATALGVTVGNYAGTNATITSADLGAQWSADGNEITVTAGSMQGLKFNVLVSGAAINTTIQTTKSELDFQIGANEDQTMSVSIANMGAKSLGVDGVDLTSSTKATAAITTIDDAIASVSSERSKLGAIQNRLEHTINNLGTSSENLSSAESRIRDVDMAKEMMEFTKNNILSQAAQSMLAQANQQPQGVLQLLQ